MRWVSMARRRMRSPLSRSCSQIGVFQSGGSALEHLGAPDVVDEHVDVAVLVANPVGQCGDLVGVEVVD